MPDPILDKIDLKTFSCNTVHRVRLRCKNLENLVRVELEQDNVYVGSQPIDLSVFDWIPASATYTPDPNVDHNDTHQYIDIEASPRGKKGSACTAHVIGDLKITLTNLDANGQPLSNPAAKTFANVIYEGHSMKPLFKIVAQSSWVPFRPVWLKLECLRSGPYYATPNYHDYHRCFHDCWFVYTLPNFGKEKRTYRCRWRMIRCEMPSDQPQVGEHIKVYLQPRVPLPWGILRMKFFCHRIRLLWISRGKEGKEYNGIGPGPGPTTTGSTYTPPTKHQIAMIDRDQLAVATVDDFHGDEVGARFNDLETMFVPPPLPSQQPVK
jgi:hypothetical protein